MVSLSAGWEVPPEKHVGVGGVEGGLGGEIVSPLELSFPHPQLECQGGGGEALLGGETEGLE